MLLRTAFAFAFAVGITQSAFAQHRVLTVGDDALYMFAPEGAVEWQMPWRGIHDIHFLSNGNILTVQNFKKVVEIDPIAKKVVWEYDAAANNGNAGKPIEIHAIQPLDGGRVMIAESGPARIIEVDRDGKLVREVKLKVDHPAVHRDTRLARKIANGNYLVCHEGDGVVREYEGASGNVVWEFPVPLFDQERKDGHGPEAFGNQCFSAIRLPNGNTMIGTGNGHSVLEVSPEKKIVWELHQNELPGITLAWVTTLELLPNGNLVFGNCHAGAGQPQLIEIDRATKKVFWTFDHFDQLGNSVTNSVILDHAGKTIR